MRRLGGPRWRALILWHRIRGRWSVWALLYGCRAGFICRFSRRRAFFRHRALTDALTARFELAITGFDRIIAVAAGAGDIVICLLNNLPPIVERIGMMNLAKGCLVATMDKIFNSGMTAETSSVRAVSETSTTSAIAPEHCSAELVRCAASWRSMSKSSCTPHRCSRMAP